MPELYILHHLKMLAVFYALSKVFLLGEACVLINLGFEIKCTLYSSADVALVKSSANLVLFYRPAWNFGVLDVDGEQNR